MDEDYLDILKYAMSPSKFIKDVLGLEVKWFHQEWLDLLQRDNKICLLAPRSSGKSLMISGYLIWKICQYPKIRVLMVTMNQSKAEEMMSFIKTHLESNEKLISIYGEQRSGSWSSSELRIKNRGPGIVHKEPTLQCLGVNSSQISSHYDLIILDDIVDNINCLTRNRRKKMEEWYNTVLVEMLEPNGQIINIGTLWHLDDFHNYLMGKSIFTTKIYKAIINDETKEVIWPERYTYDDLITLRDENIGSIAFEMQYQNNIIQTDESPIRIEWVEASKEKWSTKDDEEPLKMYIGVDLASKSSTGDYFSIAVVGLDKNNTFWVFEVIRDKISMNKQLELIKSLSSKWMPKFVGIESNATQRIITDQWMDDTCLPIKQLKSSFINDKWSRVQKISILLETGRLMINPDLEILCDELISFPRGSHDDEIDALSFAIQSAGDIEKSVNWDRVLNIVSSRKCSSGLIKV